MVFNLSHTVLSEAENAILEKGLDYALRQNEITLTHFTNECILIGVSVMMLLQILAKYLRLDL